MLSKEVRRRKVEALVDALVELIEHFVEETARPVQPPPVPISPRDSDEGLDAGLWTVRQAARFLNLSVSWVYKQAELGTLPTVRLGASVRFDPRALRAFVKTPPDRTSSRTRRALGRIGRHHPGSVK
jgi:excisionase family DNA binding protein